jgi:uncharacterized protein
MVARQATQLETIPLADARRIALAAQGFDKLRPRRVDARHLRAVVDTLALVQIDSVNVVAPAHYQVFFSRLGAYTRSLLDDLLYTKRAFTEQWAHEASIIPVETWPLLRHRMNSSDRRLRALGEYMSKHTAYASRVLNEVRERGPLTAAEMSEPDGSRGKRGKWWGWTHAKAALEGHFAFGALAIAGRRQAGFARVYDLAERVLPDEHYRLEVDANDARLILARKATRALGVFTTKDLANYFNMPVADARSVLQQLIALGEVREVRVEGWRDSAYVREDAARPRQVERAAVLSPFDPVMWFRPRAERMFGFEYRIEVYTPAPKRRWGYYVLPFLHGERIVARIDLKADRAEGVLRVLAAHRESHAPDDTSLALATELQEMARWLELGEVHVAAKGNLARALRRQV